MKNPCNTQFYITEKGYHGVKNFKYVGGSSSILYGCFWSPFCNWIVDNLIPSNIAPNAITLFASLQLIATHIAIMCYSPGFDQEIPAALCIWTGISTLLYQILDNCDGKQARKTGTSSPLGMLFDHGCDSVITWVILLSVYNVTGLGQNSLSYFSAIFISQITFYMAQWSQYHVGVFKLGYINAVDEGLVFVEGIFIITGIMGQSFWSNQVSFLFDLPFNQLVVYSTLFGAIVQIILFTYDTITNKEGDGSILPSLTCVFWLIGAYSLVYYFAPTGFIESYGLYVHYTFGSLFSKVTLQVQLAHLTHEDFKQMTFSFVFVTLFMVISFAINGMVGEENLSSAAIILTVAIIMGIISELHMAICVSSHIASILHINVLSIKKQEDTQQFVEYNNNSQLEENPGIATQNIELYNKA